MDSDYFQSPESVGRNTNSAKVRLWMTTGGERRRQNRCRLDYRELNGRAVPAPVPWRRHPTAARSDGTTGMCRIDAKKNVSKSSWCPLVHRSRTSRWCVLHSVFFDRCGRRFNLVPCPRLPSMRGHDTSSRLIPQMRSLVSVSVFGPHSSGQKSAAPFSRNLDYDFIYWIPSVNPAACGKIDNTMRPGCKIVDVASYARFAGTTANMTCQRDPEFGNNSLKRCCNCVKCRRRRETHNSSDEFGISASRVWRKGRKIKAPNITFPLNHSACR